MTCVTDQKEVVDREQRQLVTMMDRLVRFRGGEIRIGETIGDLEGLLSELQLMDEAWRDRFVDAWSDLEIPYAFALDQLAPVPDASDWTVRQGLHALEALVAEGLASL